MVMSQLGCIARREWPAVRGGGASFSLSPSSDEWAACRLHSPRGRASYMAVGNAASPLATPWMGGGRKMSGTFSRKGADFYQTSRHATRIGDIAFS